MNSSLFIEFDNNISKSNPHGYVMRSLCLTDHAFKHQTKEYSKRCSLRIKSSRNFSIWIGFDQDIVTAYSETTGGLEGKKPRRRIPIAFLNMFLTLWLTD